MALNQLQINAGVSSTAAGTLYLQEPHVGLLAATSTFPHVDGETYGSWAETMVDFGCGFAQELGFFDYPFRSVPEPESEAETLIQSAGQVCYLSLGPKGTPLENDGKYIAHLIEAGHTSVLEHASATFLCWGVSRSLTHELVRHRLASFSQASQRFTAGPTLRFVERPEFVNDESLHLSFEQFIDFMSVCYRELTNELYDKQEQAELLAERDPLAQARYILSDESKTARRKKVQGAARAVLPNCVESPIVVTMNLRAWRHFLYMRATAAAEVEIRALAMKLYHELCKLAPNAFADFRVVALGDGTQALECEHVA